MIVVSIIRQWRIHLLRQQWADDRFLRKAAIIKGWVDVLEVFNFERSHQEIKQETRCIAPAEK
ncbi:TPA: hypothetical protein SMF26_001328 [Serratia marcescens]|nr:hypothetical protein [Serratia marcescens]